MGELKIGLLYLGLHNQLVKGFGENTIITHKEFFGRIGKHFLVPKNIRFLLLKEMIKKDLVQKVDRDKVKILPSDINIETEEGVHKLYEILGDKSINYKVTTKKQNI